MRIGIDAKWYFEGPPSGKRVVRNLVNSMLKIDDKNEYVIFLNKKHRNEAFPFSESNKLRISYIWAGNNGLSNIFVLPFFSRRYLADVTLYQTFISPLERGASFAYIHDVLFLSNPEYYTFYERLYFSPLKFLTRWASAIVTVSNEEKKRLLAYGFGSREEKIIVAYHGVEPEFTTIENYSSEIVEAVKLKYSLPNKFLLFVGRLNLRKNIDNLLRAIPLLKDKNIPLVIVGADDWKKSNHSLIVEELGIQNRIHFTGAIYKELNVVYALAEIFCFPSYAESFGLPPLEAMASGVPVVTSNSTSLPEVCGPAGNYVNPNNPAEIANAIDNLLVDKQLYKNKREMGLQQAKKFTWEIAARKVIDAMSACLNR